MIETLNYLMNYSDDEATIWVIHAWWTVHHNNSYSDNDYYSVYTDLKKRAENIDLEYETSYAANIKHARDLFQEDYSD